MIPNGVVRNVASSHVTESAEFGISVNDTAHIMGILRDTLYSDKILAVLREYGSNAWDAHRDVGKNDVPIKVTLPTAEDPTLSIRDFGLGLSPDGVFKVYTQYGASTKRSSDNSVGMLGIGSKSGFAYSDSFTVTSYHGGTKRTYVAVLDASEKGRIDLLCEEPCGEETGVDIRIAVRPEDIRTFSDTAKELYRYFIPRPEINTTLPKAPEAQATLKNGVIYVRDQDYPYTRKWVAIMGCVSYNINLGQVNAYDATASGGAAQFLNQISGALYFDIGDVQVSASREELKYSASTKLAVVNKFNALVDEFVRHTLTTIQTGGFSAWEKRVRAQVLDQLGLPAPSDYGDLTSTDISVKDKIPASFVVMRYKVPVSGIKVMEHTRLILLDDRRAISGYSGENGVSSQDYFIHATTHDKNGQALKVSWSDIETDVAILCAACDITGIPVIRLSSLPWKAQPRNGSIRVVNAKHRLKVFSYLPDKGYRKPWSACWEAVEHVAGPSDVFVIIEGFKTPQFDLGAYYREDQILAHELGGVLPTIYGYKSTEKAPVAVTTCQGTNYFTWRDTFAAMLITPELKDHYARLQWTRGTHSTYFRYSSPDKKVYAKLKAELGEDHLITQLAKNVYEGAEHSNAVPGIRKAISILEKRLPDQFVKDDVATGAITEIMAKYPLLGQSGRLIAELWGDYAKHWRQYVKLIDAG